jgi:hypothetical protein
LGEELIDKDQSLGWSKFGDIKRETGITSTIMTAEDQELSTKYFKKKF